MISAVIGWLKCSLIGGAITSVICSFSVCTTKSEKFRLSLLMLFEWSLIWIASLTVLRNINGYHGLDIKCFSSQDNLRSCWHIQQLQVLSRGKADVSLLFRYSLLHRSLAYYRCRRCHNMTTGIIYTTPSWMLTLVTWVSKEWNLQLFILRAHLSYHYGPYL